MAASFFSRCAFGDAPVQDRSGVGAAASVAIGIDLWAVRNRALPASTSQLWVRAVAGPGRRAQQSVGVAHLRPLAAVQGALTRPVAAGRYFRLGPVAAACRLSPATRHGSSVQGTRLSP